MRKIIVPSLFLLAIGSVAYFFWRSFTGTPPWYQAEQTVDNLNKTSDFTIDVAAIQRRVEQQVNQQLQNRTQFFDINTEVVQPAIDIDQEVVIQLNEQEINQLIQAKIIENEHQNLSSAVESIQTNINKEAIEIGTVINPFEIYLNLPEDQKALEQVFGKLARFSRQDIYVGFEGKPRAEAGKLVFDQNSRVRIGSVNFPVEEASQKLGMPSEKILQRLELELAQFELQDLELSDKKVLLKVSPKDDSRDTDL